MNYVMIILYKTHFQLLNERIGIALNNNYYLGQ